jgi:RNA polymerase sigma-70 factor (ECF subfamily)
MELQVPTDAELVAESIAGDRDAFGQLYDRHARMVRAVVLAVSGDWSAVEDMTQESFLRAYRKLETLRDRNSFRPWIVGIARQVARERRRTLRRDRHEFGDPQHEIETRADGDAIAEQRDQIENVKQRLAALPEDERLAIHAYFLDEENATRVAERLELSRSGFYALLQRALARLATRLQPTDESTKAVRK